MKTILNKLCWINCVLLCIPSISQAAWSINDVTYLFPMPANSEVQSKLMTLKTVSIRDGKAMLEPQVFAKILGGFYDNMTMLAARIDPCFKDQFTDKCRKQVRLVWQPLVAFNQKIISIDVALHTFYDLTDTEFLALTNEIQTLKKTYSIQTDGQALWVHPGFKKDSETPYQREFMRLILSKIGFSNTSRIAVMRMGMRGQLWEFQSFDVENGIVRGTMIFDTGAMFQRFANISAEGEFNSSDTLTEAAKNEHSDQLMRVLNQSTDPSIQTPEALKLYLGRSIRLEQPSAHLPGTIDCISCHASTNVKVWAANKLIQTGFKVDLSRKPSRHNYLNRSRTYGPTSNFRALGYISDSVQVSDRTINESADVADFLNRLK